MNDNPIPEFSPLSPRPPLSPEQAIESLNQRLRDLTQNLEAERTRAQKAEDTLKHQESLRLEVESHLKEISAKVRREKAERDLWEEKARDRGRVEALEKRLDEVHDSLVSLLRRLLEKESAPPAAPSLLGAVAQEIHARLSGWERSAALDAQRLQNRLESFARERGQLLKEVEERHREILSQIAQNRGAEKSDQEHQESEIARKLEALLRSQNQLAEEAGRTRERLAQIADRFLSSGAVKDQIVRDLERTQLDLSDALREKSEALRLFALERQEIENALGENLMQLTRQLEEERRKYQELEVRLNGLERDNALLKQKAESIDKTSADQQERYQTLAGERDSLARSWLEENQKSLARAAEWDRVQKEWGERLSEMNNRLSQESASRLSEQQLATELRAQIATLSEHLSRVLREKDALSGRYASWEKEREKMLDTLKGKDEMISMLNAAFRNMVKDAAPKDA